MDTNTSEENQYSVMDGGIEEGDGGPEKTEKTAPDSGQPASAERVSVATPCSTKTEKRGNNGRRQSSTGRVSQHEWNERGRRMLLNSQLLYQNSVPYASGYERMYIGVQKPSREAQDRTVQRLAAYNPEKVPASRSKYGPRYEQMGLFGSFQANANGKLRDGFNV